MQPPAMSKPAALLCYLCGKEFGTSSLKFHVKSCAAKWYGQVIKAERKPEEVSSKSAASL